MNSFIVSSGKFRLRLSVNKVVVFSSVLLARVTQTSVLVSGVAM